MTAMKQPCYICTNKETCAGAYPALWGPSEASVFCLEWKVSKAQVCLDLVCERADGPNKLAHRGEEAYKHNVFSGVSSSG